MKFMHLINLRLLSLSLRSLSTRRFNFLPLYTQKIPMFTNLSLIPPKETPSMITPNSIHHVPFLPKNIRKIMIF